MGGFSDLKAALVDAVFEEFGEPAQWFGDGRTVQVRYLGETDEERLGRVAGLAEARHIEVRASEIEEVAEGEVFTIPDGPDAGSYVVIGEPAQDRRRVWRCGVTPE